MSTWSWGVMREPSVMSILFISFTPLELCVSIISCSKKPEASYISPEFSPCMNHSVCSYIVSLVHIRSLYITSLNWCLCLNNVGCLFGWYIFRDLCGLFYVMIQVLGVFGQIYDTWLAVTLWCILPNLWHVAHNELVLYRVYIWHVTHCDLVVYLGICMTHGLLWPCCVFGQMYDAWLSVNLPTPFYTWANLCENQVKCPYCSYLFPLWSCAYP